MIEGPQSRVWDEAENRLHVQKAIMATLMGSEAARQRGSGAVKAKGGAAARACHPFVAAPSGRSKPANAVRGKK